MNDIPGIAWQWMVMNDISQSFSLNTNINHSERQIFMHEQDLKRLNEHQWYLSATTTTTIESEQHWNLHIFYIFYDFDNISPDLMRNDQEWRVNIIQNSQGPI